MSADQRSSSLPQPSAGDARLSRADEARKAGRLAEAETGFRAVLTDEPSNAAARLGLGRLAMAAGRPKEAIDWFESARQAAPNDLLVLANLALALRRAGRIEEAADRFAEAVDKGARDPVVFREWGKAAADAKRPEVAVRAFAEATRLQPTDAETWARYANVLRDTGEADAAVGAGRRAVSLAPRAIPGRFALASALIASGQFDDGAALARDVIAEKPDHAEARFNLGWALLAQGRFTEGFKLYEDRLAVHPDILKPPAGLTRWRGEAPDGRPLVVVSEQGFGDILMFARFLIPFAEAGHKIVLHTEPRLVPLMDGFPGVLIAAPYGTPPPLEAQRYVPLQSLAHHLGATPRSVGATVPYLTADPDRLARARQWLGEGGYTIGLQWRGNPKGTIDRGRSVPLPLLAQLADIPNVRLVALQRGPGLAELAELPGRPPIRVPPNDLDRDGAFLDTAALITALDAVITCDTSIAHLTGALGQPGHVLLKHVAEWRWGIATDKSPWYPSLKLYRQPSAGDWAGAIEPVAEHIRRAAR